MVDPGILLVKSLGLHIETSTMVLNFSDDCRCVETLKKATIGDKVFFSINRSAVLLVLTRCSREVTDLSTDRSENGDGKYEGVDQSQIARCAKGL
jgi:hypothetical protein